MHTPLREMWDFATFPEREIMMRWIEPRLVRGIHLPCWIWTGRFQGSKKMQHPFDTVRIMQYPVMNVPRDLADHSKGTKEVHVRPYLSHLFWEYEERDDSVYMQCGNQACVSPHHYMITYRNDPTFK